MSKIIIPLRNNLVNGIAPLLLPFSEGRKQHARVFDWRRLEAQGWRRQQNRHCRLKAKAGYVLGCTLPFRKVQPPSKQRIGGGKVKAHRKNGGWTKQK